MRWLPLLLLLLSACSGAEAPQDPEFDGELITITIEYAEHFQLEKQGKHYLLHILDPDDGSRERSLSIEVGKKRSIISLTATLNGMVSILDASEQLKGISSIEYVYDPAIRKRFSQGKILEYGDESSHSLEKIIASGANTLLYSGFGDAFPNAAQLQKSGFEILPIYDWREKHPLGKAEWIKLVGILTGKEKEANAFFEKVKQEYAKTLALVEGNMHRPTVISGNLLGDIWYAPAGDSYMASIIQDAGGRYTHADAKGTGSNEFSIEQILRSDRETDFWINPGMSTRSMIDKLNPHAKHLKAYHSIYCYSPKMNKFWERSAAEPHLVLADLIHIFHPEIKEIQEFHFYSKIK